MNKYVTMLLKFLKYVGILLLIGYLYLVVDFYNNPMQKGIRDKSFIDRLEEALAEALYVGVGSSIEIVYEIFGNTAMLRSPT